MGLFAIVPCVASRSLFLFEASSPAALEVISQRFQARDGQLCLNKNLLDVLPQYLANKSREEITSCDLPRPEFVKVMNLLFNTIHDPTKRAAAKANSEGVFSSTSQIPFDFLCEIVCSDAVRAEVDALLRE